MKSIRNYVRKFFIIIILIIIVIIAVVVYRHYDNNSAITKTVDAKNVQTIEKKQLLSYVEYEDLFKSIKKDIKISGLNIKASTLGGNVTAIDKELSFDKRKFLTLSGELGKEDDMKPTDEYIILEDKKQTKQVTISILYTSNYIGNDLVGWSNNIGFDNLNNNLASSTDYAVVTYKNLIVIVHQSSIDKAEMNLTTETLKVLVNMLKSYK